MEGWNLEEVNSKCIFEKKHGKVEKPSPGLLNSVHIPF